MTTFPQRGQRTHDILSTLTRWATAHSTIRAALLTSTRAIADAPIDALSDYDVILIVQELRPYVDDRGWLNDLGDVLVAYWDPIQRDPAFGIEQCGNVVQYANGLKIDFTLWPVALFQEIAAAPALPAELDAGYRVLLDKDGLTASLQPPTFRAYIPAPPTLATYQTLINDFLSDAPYVAKCLWRDELLPAKWCLDCDMKQTYLRQMLEWRMEIDQRWSVPAGFLGKGLKKRLPAGIWERVEQTYAGARIADNWEALAHTMALFRQVAIEVGEHLGYAYPDDLHQRVSAYVEQIKRLERPPAPSRHSKQPRSGQGIRLRGGVGGAAANASLYDGKPRIVTRRGQGSVVHRPEQGGCMSRPRRPSTRSTSTYAWAARSPPTPIGSCSNSNRRISISSAVWSQPL